MITQSHKNAVRAVRRQQREESFRSMHLVALFDSEYTSTEILLCTLRFYSESGLLSVMPPFSSPIDWQDDPEIEQKGPKLASYRFVVPLTGEQYEYVLDNVNDLLPQLSSDDERVLQELEAQEEARDADQVQHWRSKAGDSTYMNVVNESIPASDFALRRFVAMEIVSVRDLSIQDTISIEFHLHLTTRDPINGCRWRFRNVDSAEEVLSGRTSWSSPRYLSCTNSSRAVFGWHTHFNLQLQKPISSEAAGDDECHSPRSPTLFFCVYSQDSWQRKRIRGCGELTMPPLGYHDIEISLWKPILNVSDAMEELLIGMDDSKHFFQCCDRSGDDISSRLSTSSESTSAKLRLRFNSAEQNMVQLESKAQKHTEANLDAKPLAPLRVVKRSVNEILQSVRLQQRLSRSHDPQVQSTLPSMSAGGASAVNAILARLHHSRTNQS